MPPSVVCVAFAFCSNSVNAKSGDCLSSSTGCRKAGFIGMKAPAVPRLRPTPAHVGAHLVIESPESDAGEQAAGQDHRKIVGARYWARLRRTRTTYTSPSVGTHALGRPSWDPSSIAIS